MSNFKVSLLQCYAVYQIQKRLQPMHLFSLHYGFSDHSFLFLGSATESSSLYLSLSFLGSTKKSSFQDFSFSFPGSTKKCFLDLSFPFSCSAKFLSQTFPVCSHVTLGYLSCVLSCSTTKSFPRFLLSALKFH